MTMMGKTTDRIRIALALLMLMAAVLICTAALANDEELLWELPGRWQYTDDNETDLAILTLEEDGTMLLEGLDANGKRDCTYSGVWSIEILNEYSP